MRDGQSKLSWATGRSSGWAAFDHKQRQKQCLEPDFATEPYPPISNEVNSVFPLNGSVGTSGPPTKSFSSVVQSSAFSSGIMGNYDTNPKRLIGRTSKRTVGIEKEPNIVPAFEKLKEIHCWADDYLIKDILGAVNNDFDQASILLKSMAVSSSSEEIKTINLARQRSLPEESVHNKKSVQEEDGVFENKTNLGELKSGLEDHCTPNDKTEETSQDVCAEPVLSASGSSTHSKSIVRHLISAPVEPEWEEDDDYLSHRKDAMRAIRSAAQHSRAANNAFLRGDHFSAKQLSLKAQGEWEVAKKLNANAAKEILSIRNSEIDLWKLDLHGLHASEAIHALQEHLWKIETQIPLNSSGSTSKIVEPEVGVVYPLEPANVLGTVEKTQKNQAASWNRPTVLQVITGTGKHSRGQASLPSAVRSFLVENRYRFDETRPGVIAVCPKFRYK